jgi:thiosulfate reductase cytochrome b subunit
MLLLSESDSALLVHFVVMLVLLGFVLQQVLVTLLL